MKPGIIDPVEDAITNKITVPKTLIKSDEDDRYNYKIRENFTTLWKGDKMQ